MTPDLARDLANDIMTLVSHILSFKFFLHILSVSCFSDLSLLVLQMSHTKPYIRKKAVLIMYKVFLKYPESLRPAFPRLKEKLEDPDPGERDYLVPTYFSVGWGQTGFFLSP